jgi:hypothetical protein
MPLLDLSSSDAFTNARHTAARYPDKTRGGQRLRNIASVSLSPRFNIAEDDQIFTMGSCFAREIEKRLYQLRLSVPMAEIEWSREEISSEILNKYTVHAMADELAWALDPEGIRRSENGRLVEIEDLVFEAEPGTWRDVQLHALAAPWPIVLEQRRQVESATRVVSQCRIVILTLGLAEAWYDTQTGLYANTMFPSQAIKKFPARFRMHLLSYEDVLNQLERIHATLSHFGHPDFRMLITVSPVPFKLSFSGKDALAANTYSKSVQRAAVEAFSLGHENVDYFPSYEIVTLTDRAKSFEDDNMHVQKPVVAEIMDRVVSAYAVREGALAASRRSTSAKKRPPSTVCASPQK